MTDFLVLGGGRRHSTRGAPMGSGPPVPLFASCRASGLAALVGLSWPDCPYSRGGFAANVVVYSIISTCRPRSPNRCWPQRCRISWTASTLPTGTLVDARARRQAVDLRFEDHRGGHRRRSARVGVRRKINDSGLLFALAGLLFAQRGGARPELEILSPTPDAYISGTTMLRAR
jgi:hypothetical protein